MPEGPEITVTAQYLSANMRGKMMSDMTILSGRYQKKKPEGLTKFKKALPLKVIGVSSRGKFMWISLDGGYDLWFTFGLTGMWSREKSKHSRIKLVVDDEDYYFSDTLSYGTIKISQDKNALLAKIQSLTPDFLQDSFDLRSIKQYDEPVIKLLNNQTKIGSGLGNYLTAEILYRAKISPHRLGSKLSPKQISDLEYWIKYVTKIAYLNKDLGYMDKIDPEITDIKRRNYHPEIKPTTDFEFLVYKRKTDPKGNKVKAEQILPGRTTYWVPAVQK